MSRKLNYLNNNRIVYRRFPIKDIPTFENDIYMFYEHGTHECYELFRSKAKITTYKSLKWHLLYATNLMALQVLLYTLICYAK